MTIRRAPTLKTGHHYIRSPTWGNRPAFGVVSILYSKRQLKGHQGNYTNIETKVKNMTETTYENLTRRVDRISAEMREIGEKNGLSRLSLLANQTKTIKEDLSRLLWIELPELNDSHKIEAVSKSTTGIFFHPGIFEMDAMRQAFFKRQAMHFFDNEAEQQAYIEHAEKEYLEATVTLKDILFSKNANRKVSKDHLIEKFEEAMQ